MTEVMEAQESNRARVRRLLLGPLGFRSPRGTAPEVERALLDGVADDLAYLSDEDLGVMVDMLAIYGEGSAKCFWPARATFVARAQYVRPRPLTQMPKLLSWWASAAGQRMVQDGTLVETYLYFQKYRIPPVKDGAPRAVAEAAAENARRLLVVEEKERLSYFIDPEEVAWARRYCALRADLTALVDQARKAEQAA